MIEDLNIISLTQYAKRQRNPSNRVTCIRYTFTDFPGPVSAELAQKAGDYQKLYLLADDTPDRIDNYQEGFLVHTTFYCREYATHQDVLALHSDELSHLIFHPEHPPTTSLCEPPRLNADGQLTITLYRYCQQGEFIELEIQLYDCNTGLLIKQTIYQDIEMSQVQQQSEYRYDKDGVLQEIQLFDTHNNSAARENPSEPPCLDTQPDSTHNYNWTLEQDTATPSNAPTATDSNPWAINNRNSEEDNSQW